MISEKKSEASEKESKASEKKSKASEKKSEAAEKKTEAAENKSEAAEKQSDTQKEAVKPKDAEKLINARKPEKKEESVQPWRRSSKDPYPDAGSIFRNCPACSNSRLPCEQHRYLM